MTIAEKRRDLENRETGLLRDFIDLERGEECLGDRFLCLLKYALEGELLAEIAKRIAYKAYPIAIEERSGWLLVPDRDGQKVPATQAPAKPHSTTHNS